MKELFNRFNNIKQEDFFYIENAGYPQSIKQLVKKTKICFSKNIKEGNEINTYYIKSNPEEIMNNFVKIFIFRMSQGKFEDFFPINFSAISKYIFMNTHKFEANITHYIHITNVDEKKLMNDIIRRLINESIKGNFDLIKSKLLMIY